MMKLKVFKKCLNSIFCCWIWITNLRGQIKRPHDAAHLQSSWSIFDGNMSNEKTLRWKWMSGICQILKVRPCSYQTILTVKFDGQIYWYYSWIEISTDQICQYYSLEKLFCTFFVVEFLTPIKSSSEFDQ